jgi:hypothetical protein
MVVLEDGWGADVELLIDPLRKLGRRRFISTVPIPKSLKKISASLGATTAG